MQPARQTALYKDHLRLGGKMVEFAGWMMPIQYKGLREEHNCVRSNVGLFDVSHMGEVRVQGPNSLETLQYLTSNNVAALNANQAQYGMLMNPKGGVVDDIIIYCLEVNRDYLVCVNASNESKDWSWFNENNKNAHLVNESARWAQIAIQGPKALQLISKALNNEMLISLSPFQVTRGNFENCEYIFATTGYTGESGGEIFIETTRASALWNLLLDLGQNFGVQAIGLGARDTLRTEMKYSLYGHEIDDSTNPLEAALGWTVKLNAKDFIGKNELLSFKQKGLSRTLVGFKTTDKGIPRQGYNICDKNGAVMGVVTSGTHSPTLDAPIGIGYVSTECSTNGSQIFIDIRGRKVAAIVCETPFIKRG